MTKLYLDAGTSWSKVLEIYEDESDLINSPLFCIEDLNSYIYENKDFLTPTPISPSLEGGGGDI